METIKKEISVLKNNGADMVMVMMYIKTKKKYTEKQIDKLLNELFI